MNILLNTRLKLLLTQQLWRLALRTCSFGWTLKAKPLFRSSCTILSLSQQGLVCLCVPLHTSTAVGRSLSTYSINLLNVLTMSYPNLNSTSLALSSGFRLNGQDSKYSIITDVPEI